MSAGVSAKLVIERKQNEKAVYGFDKVLSEKNIPSQTAYVQILSYLLGICPAGN